MILRRSRGATLAFGPVVELADTPDLGSGAPRGIRVRLSAGSHQILTIILCLVTKRRGRFYFVYESQEAVTTTDRPSGVVTFEEASERFDGKVPFFKGFSIWHFLLCFSLAMLSFCVYRTVTGKPLGNAAIFWPFGVSWVLVSLVLLIGIRVTNTPYGSINRVLQCQWLVFFYEFRYPALSPETGRVRWRTVVNSELGIHTDDAYTFYERKMKQNPVLWLQYMFYRDQSNDWKKKMEGMDVPPKEFKENFEWCNSQAEKHYNLFINTTDNLEKE